MGMVIWEERAMSKRTRNTIKILFLVCWRIFFDYGFGNAPISKTGNISLIGIVISCIFTLVFGCIVEVGYHRFHLNLLDRKEASLKDLFQYFYNWKTVFIANLLELIYVSIGLIFLIVPGIIMILNYRMVS